MAKKHNENGRGSHVESVSETAPELTAEMKIDESATVGVDMRTGEMSDPPPLPQAPTIERVELLAAIQAKNIVGRAQMRYKRVKKENGEESQDPADYPERQLYRVFGTAQGTETGQSQYGDWTRFVGNFEAIRFADRKTWRAAKCFLAPIAEPLLMDALVDVKRRDSSASVVFCFDIGVKVSQRWLDTDEGNSYEYTVASVFSTQKADPLAALRSTAMTALPALAAPTTQS